MLTELYLGGASPLHRARPGLKIPALAVFCTSLFLISTWPILILGMCFVGLGYGAAKVPVAVAWRALRPALWVMIAIFAVQIYLADLVTGLFVTLRLSTMILAASLVTLTTRSSELIDGIQSGLSRAPEWVPARQIALALALALRFIPIVRQVLADVTEAQAARGMDRNLRAILVPLTVRLLKMADEMALAIDARTPE